MSDKLLAVKDNGLSGLAIQRIEAADAKTMLDVPVVDDTLAVSGAAADAKATGDAVNGVVSDINYNGLPTSLVNGITWIKNTSINATTGETGESTSFDATDYIYVGGIEKIRYLRMTSTSYTTTTGIAFYDGTKTYVSGITNRARAGASSYEWYTADIPSNVQYARFCWWSDRAQEVFGWTQKFFAYTEDNLPAGERLDTLENTVFPDALNSTQPDLSGAINASNGTVTSSTYYDHTDYIPLDGVTKIRYTRPTITGTSATGGMAFYDSGKTYISGVVNSIGNRNTGWEWNEIDVPEFAAFARFGWWSASSKTTYGITQDFAVYDASDYDKTIVGSVDNLSMRMSFGAVNNPLNLHTMPENVGVLNVIKRCRQFTDIVWTPAVDLPRCDMDTLSPPDTSGNQYYEGLFKAGTQYKGLPYGNCKVFFKTSRYNKTDTFVGFGSTFSAFSTAVRNAGSIIGQESGYRTNPVRSLPFAAVCSSLACYALNIQDYADTSEIPSIAGMTTIGKIVNNGTRIDLNILRLGDLVNEKWHHVAVITDILRDASGEVQYIEISEATTIGNGNRSVTGSQYGGLCRRIIFTTEDFFWRYASYTLLRYTDIANVPYEKSPYVDVGDELPMNPVLDLPVMPYEGEGFIYNAGYIPSTTGLLISTSYYSYIRIYKDGTEVAASPYAIQPATTLVTFDALGVSDAGEYSAYLCNMSGGSNTDITTRCHWTVKA